MTLDDDADGIAGPFVSAITFPAQTVVFEPSTVEITLADADSDGVHDPEDNCPEIANADQADFDGDAQGDRCDGDNDLAYVVGFDSGNVVRFDLTSGASSPHAALHTTDQARGIAVGKPGTIYVSMRAGTKNIVQFDASGALLRDLTLPLVPNGPGHLDISSTGDLLAGGARWTSSPV